MADINALQAAASRYAVVAGFGSVVPTGTVDDQTMNAVKSSLIWIRDHVQGESDTASGLIAAITSQSALTSHADGLANYFEQIANNNGIGGSNLDFAPQAPGIQNVKQLWGKIPTPVKIAGGLGLIVGIFFLGRSLMGRRSGVHVPFQGALGLAGDELPDEPETYEDVIDAEYVEVD